MDLTDVTFCRKKVDSQKINIGDLIAINEASGDTTLREFYNENGYLFIRDAIPRQLVLNARKEILQKYAIIGEIDDRQETTLGIESKNSYRKQINIRAFRQSLVSGYYYQAVSRFIKIKKIVTQILQHESRMLDYLWPIYLYSCIGR